jgi:hypothetical protein
MSEKITWRLEENLDKSKIKINPNNPKVRDREGYERLQKLRDQFGTIFDGILNADYSLIDGHARLEQEPTGTGNYFVPSRQLSEDEYKELNALFDLAKAGEIDQLILEEQFTEEFFEEWNIKSKKQDLEAKTIELKPYKRTHVLLSFPPERMADIQHLLEQIVKFKDVEYEQGAN